MDSSYKIVWWVTKHEILSFTIQSFQNLSKTDDVKILLKNVCTFVVRKNDKYKEANGFLADQGLRNIPSERAMGFY